MVPPFAALLLLAADAPFDGAPYRYDEMPLPERFAYDLLAIPAGIPTWDERDWFELGLVAAPTAALMFAPTTANPYDARLQSWLHAELGPDHFRVWTPVGDKLVWGAVWTATASAFAYGYFAPDARYTQMVSLMLEAFALAQVYHWTFKIALGREGPENGYGMGVIYGPPGAFRYAPAGTPSGHAATLYAMMGVVSSYWDDPVLTVWLNVLGAAFCATLVTDDYHFTSDVIWGAAMGWAIGSWVVHHRASFASDDSPLSQVSFAPLVDPNTGMTGAAVGMRW